MPGYTKVISRVILAEKSVGVHFFFPVYIKMQEHFSVGVHSFLPVTCPEMHGHRASFCPYTIILLRFTRAF